MYEIGRTSKKEEEQKKKSSAVRLEHGTFFFSPM